jgi:hypothetical protein
MPDRKKKRTSRVRETALGCRLEKRLAIYAAAAGAAGVGMLALASPAQAEIVYTPAHIQIPLNGTNIPIDFNHDGVVEFSFWIRSYADFGPTYVDLFIYGRSGPNGVERTGAPPTARLTSGAVIGPAQKFNLTPRMFGAPLMQLEEYYSQGGGKNSFCEGNWKQPEKDRYLGVTFAISGQQHFGWIRLSAGCETGKGSAGVSAIITGYAYNTEPNQSILAGQQTSAAGDARMTRDRGTLGQLALGALGLDLWRRKE